MSATQTILEATPEQRELIDRVAALIESEKPDLIRRWQLSQAAAQEPGFRGDLRRAIHSSGMHLQKLAIATGVDVIPLSDFLEGTAELTSDQIQKLVDILKLQLVRTIVREPSRTLRAKT